MKVQTIGLALAASLALGAPALAGGADGTPWLDDFDVAVERAKAEGKDLLVDFTGSDWCSWCIRLHDEVFSKSEFLDYATANYVLVALDFPRGEEAKAKVPNPERNEELSKVYDISGFPTILLVTPEGEAYARTGYQPGGAASYVEHLTEIRSTGREALERTNELLAAYATAEGAAKRGALVKILDLLETLDAMSPAAERLVGPARDAIEMDPDNAEGLKLRAVKALLAAGQADMDLVADAMDLDPKNEHGLMDVAVFAAFQAVEDIEHLAACCDALDRLIAADGLAKTERDKAIWMLANAAIWNDRYLENKERAKGYAKRLMDMNPEDEQLVGTLKGILGS